MEQRRVFIALLLSLAVVVAYQALIPKSAPKAPSPVSVAAAPAGQAAIVSGGSPSGPSSPLTDSPAGDVEERDVRVETANVIAVFTNRGARLKSWKLKPYKDRSGEPLELVARDIGPSAPLPFTLVASDEQITATLNNAVYTVKGAPTEPGPVTTPSTLTFEYRNNTGLAATKTFQIDPSSYTLTLQTTVLREGVGQSVAVAWGPGLGDTDAQTGRYAQKPEALYSVGGKVTRLAASGVAKQPAHQQDFEYVGVDDHYFASLVLKPGIATVTYAPLFIGPAAGTKDPARELMAYTVTPPRADQVLAYYIGPKDFDTLASIDRSLTRAINFGFFSVIVVPLLRSLQWIYGYVGNYGWAITILTLFINVVFFPLNHKSVVSMRRMQEIQPEAKAIQERYSKLKTTDPAKQKMNSELMALYRERGVNPASGCVPILLTLPVFLAFYALLSTAIELRGAPFFGWVHDLSLPDPYYVLPVLVALAQFVTQWMTPQPGVDPAQQKMMMIMPLVLGFMFISSPAGALIYWFVGSIFRIGQMQMTNYLIGPPKSSRPGPAAERRMKRVGQGKTEAAAREEKP